MLLAFIHYFYQFSYGAFLFLFVMQQGDSFIQYLEVSETATSFITPGNHFYHLIPTISAVKPKSCAVIHVCSILLMAVSLQKQLSILTAREVSSRKMCAPHDDVKSL